MTSPVKTPNGTSREQLIQATTNSADQSTNETGAQGELIALPHLPLGYDVKKLEWRDVDADCAWCYAKSPFGEYSVTWSFNEVGQKLHYPDGTTEQFDGMGGTGRDNAKAAAQADFERRVRECIVAKPVDVAAVREKNAATSRLNRLLKVCHGLRWTDVGVLAFENGSTKKALIDLSEILFMDGIDEAIAERALSAEPAQGEHSDVRNMVTSMINAADNIALHFGDSETGFSIPSSEASNDICESLAAYSDVKEKVLGLIGSPKEPAQGEQCNVSYRMLRQNDLIDENDEFLGDDAVTWERLGQNWSLGLPYHLGLKPARRPLPAAPTAEAGR